MLFFSVQKYSRVVDRNLEGYQKLYFSFFFYFFPNKSVFPLTIFFSKFFRSYRSCFFFFSLFLATLKRLIFFYFFYTSKNTKYERALKTRVFGRVTEWNDPRKLLRTPRVGGFMVEEEEEEKEDGAAKFYREISIAKSSETRASVNIKRVIKHS